MSLRIDWYELCRKPYPSRNWRWNFPYTQFHVFISSHSINYQRLTYIGAWEYIVKREIRKLNAFLTRITYLKCNLCMSCGISDRRVSPETQRGVCEGRGDGVAVLSSQRAPAEADLDQSHPPREGPGFDGGHVLVRAQTDGSAGSWEEPRGSRGFCQPSGELFLLSGVKYKCTQTTFLYN